MFGDAELADRMAGEGKRGKAIGVNLDSSSEGTELLRSMECLSILRYKSLMRWFAICGLVHWTDDLGSLFKSKSFRSQKWLPFMIPAIFLVSTIFQDLFCYGNLSGCKTVPLFGGRNVTYNSQTVYGWVGLLVAATALHANVLTFARSGKLEILFNRIPATAENDRKVKRTIRMWAIGGIIMEILTIGATTSFVIAEIIMSECHVQQLLCILPQSIQIISGLSMVFTGVGLSYLVSLLVQLDVTTTQERCVELIGASSLKEQFGVFLDLKGRLKQLGKDTQIGNAIAFCGGCLCIFGSLWAFSETLATHGRDTPIIWSLSLWMCLISLLLTFLAIFSFSNVTQSCDELMECIRDQLGLYVIKKETPTLSSTECFLIISSHQQRFGFEIMGILIEPEKVRAGGYAGITAAAAILKLAI